MGAAPTEQLALSTQVPLVTEEFAPETRPAHRSAPDARTPCGTLAQLLAGARETPETLEWIEEEDAAELRPEVLGERYGSHGDELMMSFAVVNVKLERIRKEIVEMHLVLNGIRRSLQEENVKLSKLINESSSLKRDVKYLKYFENLVLLLSGNVEDSNIEDMPFCTGVRISTKNLIV